MLERASRVALMKAPSSWTLDGGATSSSESIICSRAKIASGVHVLMTTQQYLDVVQEWRKPFGPPLIVSPPTKMNKKKSLRAKRKAMVRVIRQKVRLFLQIFFPPITAGEANSPMFQWPQQYSKAVALMILLVSFVISSVCGLADFFRFFFYYFIAVLYNPEAFLTTTASQHDIEPQSTMDHAEAEAAIMQPDLGLEMEVVQQ